MRQNFFQVISFRLMYQNHFAEVYSINKFEENYVSTIFKAYYYWKQCCPFCARNIQKLFERKSVYQKKDPCVRINWYSSFQEIQFYASEMPVVPNKFGFQKRFIISFQRVRFQKLGRVFNRVSWIIKNMKASL